MFWSVFVRSVAATVFVSIPTLATTVFWPGMVNPGSYAGPVSPFEQSVANSASVAEKFAVEKRGNLGNQALDSMTLLNHWQYTSSDLMEGYKSPEARCWSSGGRCWSPGARFWHGFAPVCGLDCGGNFQRKCFTSNTPCHCASSCWPPPVISNDPVSSTGPNSPQKGGGGSTGGGGTGNDRCCQGDWRCLF